MSNNGGPAFPGKVKRTKWAGGGRWDYEENTPGLSQRTLIATLYAAGTAANSEHEICHKDLAELGLEFADALIEARGGIG